MTTSRPPASWPVALGYLVAGSASTVTVVSAASAVAQAVVGGAGALLDELIVAAAVAGLVLVAVRLPRRARALFAVGALLPLVAAGLFLLWLVWAFRNYQF